ncbi:hypothetical protein LEMLEM_LOCUS12130 [Lemmus lemmus]
MWVKHQFRRKKYVSQYAAVAQNKNNMISSFYPQETTDLETKKSAEVSSKASNYINYLELKEKKQLCTASGEAPGTAQVERLREKCCLSHERMMQQLANIFSY